ncbi:MAG: methylated-DNA--[protein]-cysteine S-methyltransferase, partial [Verrucomicrobiales bacterium]
MNDYERVARVIRLLENGEAEGADLERLAELAGLSSFHFHRLFKRWAGVTPKVFLSCLRVERAKEMLRAGERVLETSLELGLSGPGRLHDLCVKLEAASPGELKRGGEGWTIRYGAAESPFGRVLVGEGPRGICHLAFFDDDQAAALAALRESWPAARLAEERSWAEELAERIFDRSKGGERAPLRAFVRGTPMQVRVWRALLRVPPGCLVTYGRLAAEIGNPRAARATGSAVGANPLAWLIPCHRVIRGPG